jgi:hypothetical protein
VNHLLQEEPFTALGKWLAAYVGWRIRVNEANGLINLLIRTPQKQHTDSSVMANRTPSLSQQAKLQYCNLISAYDNQTNHLGRISCPTHHRRMNNKIANGSDIKATSLATLYKQLDYISDNIKLLFEPKKIIEREVRLR